MLFRSVCGNAKDAKTGLPLFSTKRWVKANAVLLLAKEGFLSDVEGVPLYERAGRDKNGLMKFWCTRGTGALEGGPHGDIYRHFGALNGASFDSEQPQWTTLTWCVRNSGPSVHERLFDRSSNCL